jgi:predicted DNA-binding transcriptional regulator AlpA
MGKNKRVNAHRRNLLGRAASAAEQAPQGHPDDMLSTQQVAAWLGVSYQWLEAGRTKGYGPKFVRHSYRHVRYRRADVLAYIAANTFSTTAEYVRETAR